MSRVPAPLTWLSLAVASCLLGNVLIIGYLIRDGEPAARAVDVTAIGQAVRLAGEGGIDSWYPMARADAYLREGRQGDLYGVFFDEHVKFQYPPSALLPWMALPTSLRAGEASLEPGSALRTWLSVSTFIAVLLTIAASIRILVLGLTDGRAGAAWSLSRAQTIVLIALALALGLAFHPLNKAHNGGQVQAYLDLLVAAALLAHLKGRPAVAGMSLGLCCLMKPQYAVVLVFAALSRHWRLAVPMLGVTALGLAVSVAALGIDNHLRYIDVLRELSRYGETYWPNQSVNGLVARFLGNGVAERFSMESFPPYHPGVYYTTLASSLVILGVAFWSGRTSSGRSGGRTIDLAIALMAATMASPIAWEHHYGIFLPVFAVALPLLMRERPLGAWTGPALLVSYLAMANVVRMPERIFWDPWRGLAGSHILAGAVVLFVLCIAVRRRGDVVPGHA